MTTTYLRLLVGVLLFALDEDGDVVMLRVEHAACDGHDAQRLDAQPGLLGSFAFGALEVGFSKLEVAAGEAVLPCSG